MLLWIESVFVQVNVEGSNDFWTGTLHRPQSSDISLFNDSMYSVMEAITRIYRSCKVMLTGDLSVDLLKMCESKLTADFHSIMCSYGFSPFFV